MGMSERLMNESLISKLQGGKSGQMCYYRCLERTTSVCTSHPNDNEEKSLPKSPQLHHIH